MPSNWPHRLLGINSICNRFGGPTCRWIRRNLVNYAMNASNLNSQIRQAFLRNGYLTTTDFYRQFPTTLLIKMRAGFERDFDAVSLGDVYRQPGEWLTQRMWIIDAILHERENDQHRKPMSARAWSRVEAGQVQPINKWNRPLNAQFSPKSANHGTIKTL